MKNTKRLEFIRKDYQLPYWMYEIILKFQYTSQWYTQLFLLFILFNKKSSKKSANNAKFYT